MAESPAHRFGQIIGEVLEASVTPLLATFAKRHGLYFDSRGERPCRPGKRCTWLDLNQNKHDLDFVLERGGSLGKLGIPAAFIETAWRRYTKHSRNKAQEIQGAIVPLAETYKHARPFIGVILAGVFTDGALVQLRSLGFSVLHFSYGSVVAAFQKYGIDASFEENTPDVDFQKKVKKYESLSAKGKAALARSLLQRQRADVEQFVGALEKAVSRQIVRITILPLYGSSMVLLNVEEAIRFLETYQESPPDMQIQRYEVRIAYDNADSIEASFSAKADAIDFLETYLPVSLTEIRKNINE